MKTKPSPQVDIAPSDPETVDQPIETEEQISDGVTANQEAASSTEASDEYSAGIPPLEESLPTTTGPLENGVAGPLLVGDETIQTVSSFEDSTSPDTEPADEFLDSFVTDAGGPSMDHETVAPASTRHQDGTDAWPSSPVPGETVGSPAPGAPTISAQQFLSGLGSFTPPSVSYGTLASAAPGDGQFFGLEAAGLASGGFGVHSGSLKVAARNQKFHDSSDNESASGPEQVAPATSNKTFVDTPSQAELVPIPAVIPDDPGFANQWQLLNADNPGIDLNVTGVWDDYTGEGVVVGLVDDGIDYNHPDLAANYRHDLDWDARDLDGDSLASAADDAHGTTTSGVIAAAMDGSGAVGVAPDADITMFRMGYGYDGDIAQEVTQMQNIATVDVANNSWGYGGFFYDNFDTPTFAAQGAALENAAANGRDGLGTIVTFSAGNSGDVGQNTNYHGYQASPYTITAGAVDSSGSVAYFSTPGATVLTSAPGVSVYTTDGLGAAGYSSGDYTYISGTSFSAPAVAGVAALMLEANPDLGYRDVQEILAYSSNNPVDSTNGWQTNGAFNWNGGGLTIHDGYGFGMTDAHAAVRLAETWEAQSTHGNLFSMSGSSSPGATISDSSAVSDSISFSSGLKIDHVEVSVNIDHTWIGDLSIALTSPDGTTSLLADQPGVYSGSIWGTSQQDIDFTFGSVQHWGETGAGTWTLGIVDNASWDSGVLNDWSLTLHGDQIDDDDVYVYTDEWARHGAEVERQTLDDGGGTDTLNLAAVTTDLDIDLTPGSIGTFWGNSLAIADGTVIENIYGGDGADVFSGNMADNTLNGMRGDDELFGGGGDDTLVGGSGNDVLDGGDGSDIAVFRGNVADYDIQVTGPALSISDAIGDGGTDSVIGVESLRFDDQTIDTAAFLAPTAVDDGLTTSEDTEITFTGADLLANDIGFGLTFGTLSSPWHGTLVDHGDGSFTYRPGADFSGTETLNYTVSNGLGLGDFASLAIDVTAINDAPLAIDDAASTMENAAVSIDVLNNDSDVDGDTLSVTAASVPEGRGSVTINQDGTLTFDPGDDFGGLELGETTSVTISYTVSDGHGGVGNAVASVTVEGTIDGPAGFQSYLYGNADAETLIGGSGDDYIRGFEGADKLYGGTGDDHLLGDTGNDTLRGDAGSDVLSGGGGDDRLYADSADTLVDGGDGYDRLYAQGDAGLSIDLAAAGIEYAYGSIGDDVFDGADAGDKVTLYGRDGDDVLSGGAGNDTLRGDAGSDVLSGGGGNDTLTGGEGIDQLVGGGGDDRLYADGADTVVDGGEGYDRLYAQGDAGLSIDLAAAGIEYAYGGIGNDVFDGGGAGDKVTLYGRDGDDVLSGGAGNDSLRGDAGSDVLNGGGGNDTLTGGEGSDTFLYAITDTGLDTIKDFQVMANGDNDALDFSQMIGGYDASDTINDLIRLVENGSNTIVQVDSDGSNDVADFTDVVTLQGQTGLDLGTLETDGNIILA
jgi:subtilisin-like proprotein convertase family protein/Ca2+-binding RTX toxin-like protein